MIQNNSSPVTRLWKHCMLLYFLYRHPCLRGWVDHDSRFIFFFLSFLSHYVRYQQSQILFICCSFSPFISTISRSLLMQSPVIISLFLASFSHTLSWHPLVLPALFFISHSFYATSPGQPTRNQFLLKRSFIPTSTFSSSILLLSALLTHTILLTMLFSRTFSSCFSVSSIVYVHLSIFF